VRVSGNPWLEIENPSHRMRRVDLYALFLKGKLSPSSKKKRRRCTQKPRRRHEVDLQKSTPWKGGTRTHEEDERTQAKKLSHKKRVCTRKGSSIRKKEASVSPELLRLTFRRHPLGGASSGLWTDLLSRRTPGILSRGEGQSRVPPPPLRAKKEIPSRGEDFLKKGTGIASPGEDIVPSTGRAILGPDPEAPEKRLE